MEHSQLVELIRKHRPWHQNLGLTPNLDVRAAFSPEELRRENNENVAFFDHHKVFTNKIRKIYPGGVEGKTFLDCACNAGSYCFWMRELGASSAHGFDVREHWINQAKLIQQHSTVLPTDQITFEVCDLMRLPERNIQPVDLVMFKGIFYHLADPIRGLKIAADLARETIWLNTSRMFVDDDRSLHCVFEDTEAKMSGAHSLSWIPTGPKVIAMMLYWLGFEDIWHVFSNQNPNNPKHGRMEIIASRKKGSLDGLEGHEDAQRMNTSGFSNASVADGSVLSMH